MVGKAHRQVIVDNPFNVRLQLAIPNGRSFNELSKNLGMISAVTKVLEKRRGTLGHLDSAHSLLCEFLAQRATLEVESPLWSIYESQFPNLGKNSGKKRECALCLLSPIEAVSGLAPKES